MYTKRGNNHAAECKQSNLMPPFTDLEGQCLFMLQFVLKIVYISLALLYLYRFCIILVSPFNWFMLRVFNVKVKNLAFDTSKLTQMHGFL